MCSRTTPSSTAFELGIYPESLLLGAGKLGWGPVTFSTRSSAILPPHSCSLLPPLSPASANICNVVLMRYGELEEGIDVLDGDGNLVGSSKIAARHVGHLGAQGTGGEAGNRDGVSFIGGFCTLDLSSSPGLTSYF